MELSKKISRLVKMDYFESIIRKIFRRGEQMGVGVIKQILFGIFCFCQKEKI